MMEAESLFNLLEVGDFRPFRDAADRSPCIRVCCDRNGDFLLHRAVALGLLEACKYLLDRGIPAVCPGSRGATPLHYAAARGDAAIIEILLEAAGPNHSPVNMHGMTPLHVAAGEGRLAIVGMLAHKGADSSAQDKFGRLPLHYAAGTDQLAVVRWMVRRDDRLIDLPDAFGQRPIHWALQFGCARTAAWLLHRGVDLIGPDVHGRSPLSLLVLSDQSGPLRLLAAVRLGMATKAPEPRRLTPLQRAILRGDIKQVRQRLRNLSTLNRRGDLGRTALHAAAFARNRDLFLWMRKKGANARVVDDYGWTPTKLLSYRLITGPNGMYGDAASRRRACGRNAS